MLCTTFRIDRKAVRNARVSIKEIGEAESNSPAPIAGTIAFQKRSLWVMFSWNWNLFPQNGGYKVETDKVYEIAVTAKGIDGEIEYTGKGLESEYVFASRAIVDFDVSLDVKPDK